MAAAAAQLLPRLPGGQEPGPDGGQRGRRRQRERGRPLSPESPEGRRVGLFGGTFDPPHTGHLIVAQDVVEALELEELRFVVAGDPPHKAKAEASPEARARMAEAAVAGDPRLRVSRIELEREGPSYTVDTLRRLTKDEPDAAFVLVIGADQLRDFASWKEPAEVARLARLAVMSREGNEPRDVEPGVDMEYDIVDVTRIDLSSTRVRERISSGRSLRYVVPEAVRRIIEEEGPYRDLSC